MKTAKAITILAAAATTSAALMLCSAPAKSQTPGKEKAKAISAAKASGRGVDADDISLLLFDQAQILDGEVPDDPAEFAKRLNRLVVRGVASSPT